MSSRWKVLLTVSLLAAGAALWARRREPPPTPPAPTVIDDEPAPVEVQPPESPPRGDSAAEFVERILHTLAAPEAEREVAVAELIDLPAVALAAFGEAWAHLSPEQRLGATRDLGAALLASAERGARSWLPRGPHVSAVQERGAATWVSTTADSDIEVRFIVARRAGSWTVLDVEVEGVSTVRTYRVQFERILAEHQGDPAPLLDRLARKAARSR